MFSKPTTPRPILAVLALAVAALLTPSAPAEVHLRFGYRGHHGHHSYHGHRAHHGRHGYHRYRGYYRYRQRLYRPHRYRYHRSRYYPHRYTSRSSYGHERAVRVVVPETTGSTSRYPGAEPEGQSEPRRETDSTSHDAWRLFRDGRYVSSYNTFARAAASDPEAGEPKLGYALSAAMRGDDSRAAYAMRRVLKFDPDVLDQSAPIRGRIIQELIDRYEYQDDADSRLMLRAMKRLQRAQEEPGQSARPPDATSTPQPSQTPDPGDHSPDEEENP